MRRVYAIVLLVAFLSQTSGSALAVPARNTASIPWHVELATELATAITAIQTRLEGTYVYALFTGTTNLYNAVHAPAPVFPRHPKQLVAPNTTRIAHSVPAMPIRPGYRVQFVHMLSAPILPRYALRDPLAMRIATPTNRTMLSTRTTLNALSTQRTKATPSPAPSAAPTFAPLVIPPPYMTVSPTAVSGNPGGNATVSFTCYTWDSANGVYDSSPCSFSGTITTTNGTVANGTGGTINFYAVGTATLTYEYGTKSTLWPTVAVTVTAATPTPSPSPLPTPTPSPTPCPSGWLGVPPSCMTPVSTPSPNPLPTSSLPLPTTGINHYWTYEEGAIPGVGRWMLNVGTGNLLVQDDDLDVASRGIDLAFRRTFDSQSQHDIYNDDGSVPSLYGNGWSNTLDAHMAYRVVTNGSTQTPTLSVYDIDGARYDYCPNSQGGWATCVTGSTYNTLSYDGACGYFWTKKTGTVYYFIAPVGASCTASPGFALAGRPYAIFGRNHNNVLTFQYAMSNPNDITTLSNLTVRHSDGQALTLSYGLVNGHPLLTSIARPDGATVTFGYDANGNLTDVYDIGNNAATNATPIHHQYGYAAAAPGSPSSGYVLNYADSANWVMSNGSTGAFVSFSYDGSNRTTAVQYTGTVDPVPNDGTNVQLQAGYPNAANCSTTGCLQYRTEDF